MGLISTRRNELQPRRWLEAALDVLFPPQCPGCGLLGAVWCQDCQARIERLNPPVCDVCGTPVRPNATCCAQCEGRSQPLTARSYAWYQSPMDSGILRLKYRRDSRLAGVMAGWLQAVYIQEGWRADLVAAVPLGASRLAQRGYNQASLLGRALGDRLCLPFADRVLRRTRETGSQVGLNASERRRNVAGAFAADPGAVDGLSVLVVDDLYTTGSTLGACAQALSQAGALKVYGLTLGRAGRGVSDGR